MTHQISKCQSQFICAALVIALALGNSSLYAAKPSPILFNLTPPVNFNWAGAYVGGYLGGAWANGNPSTNTGGVTPASYFTTPADISSVNQNGGNSLYASTPMLGIQFGENFTLSPLMTVGLVMDYGYFHLSETNSKNNIAYPSGAGTYSEQTSINTNWLYTIRGRVGYTPPTAWPVMIYGTGGLAVTNLQVANNFTDTTSLGGAGTSRGSNNENGWTLGVGVEAPLTEHVTIDAEYLYLNFGTVNANASVQNSTEGFGIPANSLTSPYVTSMNLYANLFKLGLNYKF